MGVGTQGGLIILLAPDQRSRLGSTPSTSTRKEPYLSDIENWYLDNYGICTVSNCLCLHSVWHGRACVYWKSFNAKNPEELRVAQQQFRACSSTVRAERS